MTVSISLKKLLNKILQTPLVVEEGTSGIWTYCKWSDGAAEWWGRYSGQPTTGTHYWSSAPLYGYRVEGITFPNECKPINTSYVVSLNWHIGNAFAMSAGNVASKTVNGFTIYGISTGSGVSTVECDMYVRGRWKAYDDASQGWSMRGMSYTGSSKAEMVEELKQMMNETTDQTVKTAIQDAIAKMNK